MYRIAIIGAAGVAAVFGVERIDRAINYLPVQAQVRQAVSSCSLRETTRLVGTTVKDFGPMSCERAESMQQDDEVYRKMQLVGELQLTFQYRSPADGRAHVAEVALPLPDYNTLASLGTGDSVTVLAHKRQPTLFHID